MTLSYVKRKAIEYLSKRLGDKNQLPIFHIFKASFIHYYFDYTDCAKVCINTKANHLSRRWRDEENLAAILVDIFTRLGKCGINSFRVYVVKVVKVIQKITLSVV